MCLSYAEERNELKFSLFTWLQAPVIPITLFSEKKILFIQTLTIIISVYKHCPFYRERQSEQFS